MTLKQWIKTPKSYVILVLVSYLFLASVGSHDIRGIRNALIAVAIAIIIDLIYNIVEDKKRFLPDGPVITGLIIALILGISSSWFIVMATSVIAILGKHMFIYRKKPIFNPAAFGLLFSVLIFKSEQSWWGAFGDLPWWTVILLIIGGYFITDRVNKYPQVLSFLGTSFLMLLVMGYMDIGNAPDALRPPFINATLFFGFFMLTDPPTTPAKVKEQLVFGFVTAFIGTIVYGIFGGLIYLFVALLIGNLYHFIIKRLIVTRQAHSHVKRTKRTVSSR